MHTKDKPIKSLGQNFLKYDSVAYVMINALDIREGDTVVEVGPGKGVITQKLIALLKTIPFNIIAVDIDIKLVEELKKRFEGIDGVELIADNFLDWYPRSIDKKHKVIGSLPYYITSPIIHSVIKENPMPEKCVFMVQKEVAKKIIAKEPDASYLSAFVQTFYNPRIVDMVSKNSFYPVPKVDSAILELTKLPKPVGDVDLNQIERYEGFLHKGFSHPRKMLNKVFTKEELSLGGINPNLRPQNLSVLTWVEVFKILYTSNISS